MYVQRRLICTIAMTVLLCGCGGEDGNGDSAAMPGDLGSLQSAMSEAASEAIEAAKKEYASQLKTEESKVDAAKVTAKTLSDEQLDKLIYQLDTLVANAHRKLESLSKVDEGTAKTLQSELAGLMTEIPALYDQAMARIAELNG